jgi:hypothetical protein
MSNGGLRIKPGDTKLEGMAETRKERNNEKGETLKARGKRLEARS